MAQGHYDTASNVTEGFGDLLYSNSESATELIMEERGASEIFTYSNQT